MFLPSKHLLSAFYDNPPSRTILRTSVPTETLTRHILRTLLRSTSFLKEPSKNPYKSRVLLDDPLGKILPEIAELASLHFQQDFFVRWPPPFDPTDEWDLHLICRPNDSSGFLQLFQTTKDSANSKKGEQQLSSQFNISLTTVVRCRKCFVTLNLYDAYDVSSQFSVKGKKDRNCHKMLQVVVHFD